MQIPKDIHLLIEDGESPNVEFKSSFNTDVIETLVAFANAEGGIIIIGVNKNRLITGVSINSESVQNWVNEIKIKTTPSLIPEVDIVDIENINRTIRFRNYAGIVNM